MKIIFAIVVLISAFLVINAIPTYEYRSSASVQKDDKKNEKDEKDDKDDNTPEELAFAMLESVLKSDDDGEIEDLVANVMDSDDEEAKAEIFGTLFKVGKSLLGGLVNNKKESSSGGGGGGCNCGGGGGGFPGYRPRYPRYPRRYGRRYGRR